jgi:RNA polymerase sigma factor (sigma-70 family)
LIYQRYRNYRTKRYDVDDLVQEAMLTIVEAYPRAELKAAKNDLPDPEAYFGVLVWGATKNYYVRNGFMVSAVNSAVYKQNEEMFKRCFAHGGSIEAIPEAASASGLMVSDHADEINLRMDIAHFCEKYDRNGVLLLRMQGYTIKEIAEETGITYKQVSKMHVSLKRQLKEFLEQDD